jgi:hypothetical protein
VPKVSNRSVAIIASIAFLIVLGIGSIATWKGMTLYNQIRCGVVTDGIWGLRFRIYSSEDPEKKYPPTSSIPGNLFPAYESIYPKFATETEGGFPEFCSSATRAYKKLSRREKLLQPTYAYFGYVLQNEDELLTFLDCYPGFLEKGVDFDNDLPAPAGRGSFGGDQFLRLREVKANAQGEAPPEIPIMIEIPDYTEAGIRFRHQKEGGYVLSFRGARFREYGKEFPMTPAVIEKIGEIKAMYRQQK